MAVFGACGATATSLNFPAIGVSKRSGFAAEDQSVPPLWRKEVYARAELLYALNHA